MLCILPGLICFQREAGQEVPGCQGSEGFDSRADYCILIQDVLPEDAKTMVPSFADTMAETMGDTMANTVTETMSMSDAAVLLLGASEFLGTAVTTTLEPTEMVLPLGSLAVVGQNGLPNRRFPLGHCEGDCDSDSEVGHERRA
jgi:hypothetical protein